MNKKVIFKSTLIVSVLTLASGLIGFFRDVLVARQFGATYITDSYTVAMTIPNILFGVIGAAISTAFIPLLTRSLENQGKDEMLKFSNNVINITFVISIVLFVLSIIFNRNLVKLIVPNFSGEAFRLTVELTKLSLVNILFMSLTACFTSILQVFGNYRVSAFAGLLISVPLVFYLLSGSHLGAYGMVLACVIGYGIQCVFLIPWLIKNRFRFNLKVNIYDTRLREMMILIGPILIGTGVSQLNVLINKAMASGLPEGSIAAFDFANKLTNITHSVFAYTIVTIVYPILSKVKEKNDYDAFRNYLLKCINYITILMVPAGIGFIVLRKEIIGVLFMHGKFDSRAVGMTASVLLYLSIGMIFYGIRDICNRAFYSLGNTKTPMISGILGMICCIVLNIVLVPRLGISGLGLSNTMAAIFSTVLLLYNLYKILNGLDIKFLVIENSKILISSLLMGSFIYIVKNGVISKFIVNNQLLVLVIYITLGFFVYVLLLIIFRFKGIEDVRNILSKRKINSETDF